VVEKTAKSKTTVKPKVATQPAAAQKGKEAEKPKVPEKAKPAEKPKASEKARAEKSKQPGALARWWRETLGELRKVTWPTPEEAWRLTRIVLVVMFVMSMVLGLLDFIFSWLIRLILS